MITDGFWQELLRYRDSVVRWSMVLLPTVPSTIFITVAHDSISTTAMSKTLVGEPLSTYPAQPQAELAQSTRTQSARRTRCEYTITRWTCSGVGPLYNPCHPPADLCERGGRHILGSHGSGRIVRPVPRSAASNANRNRGRSHGHRSRWARGSRLTCRLPLAVPGTIPHLLGNHHRDNRTATTFPHRQCRRRVAGKSVLLAVFWGTCPRDWPVHSQHRTDHQFT